jgi:dTDP-4-dehydrorhamnose 3,5-epimerase
MIFEPTPIAGAVIVRLEKREDDRGHFARTFCREEFRRAGIPFEVSQCNVSWNRARGTLRGMHFQRAPHEEAKLIACTRGRIHDVALDVRPGSPTFGRNAALTLDPRAGLMLYLAPGLAHGFLTLEDDTEVAYWMSASYAPGGGAGVRYDDPLFAIPWPEPVRFVSERDRAWPDARPDGTHG